MQQREVVQVAVVAGWAAGLVLVLAAASPPAAAAVFGTVAGTALVCARWRLAALAWMLASRCWRRIRPRARGCGEAAPRRGGAVERAA